MLTRDDLRTYVRDQLGLGAVEVELKDSHIDSAITETTALYNAYAPIERWGLLNATQSGRYRYTARTPVNPDPLLRYVPGLQRIVEVVGVRNNNFNGQIDLFDPLLYLSGGINNAQGLAMYTMATMYLNQARTVLNAAPEWQAQVEYDATQGGPVFVLSVHISSTAAISQIFGVRMLIQVTADDDEKTGLAYVRDSREYWFRSYTLARCKVILGRILGKFGGIPSMNGEVIRLDQDSLKAEGLDEMRELKEEIVRSTVTFGPVRA